MLVSEDRGVDLILERWHQATPLEKKQGKTWYLQAHDFALHLSFRYGVSLKISAGVIAALSPKNKWVDNKRDAELVLLHENTDSRGDLSQNDLSSHHPKLDNVYRILDGVDPDKTLGQKARSFYRCIFNPMTDEVCVDTWSARVIKYTDKWITKEDYPVIQNYYVQAAEQVGTLPPIMQATTWIQIRGKHD